MAVATGITYLFRTSGQVLAVSLSGAIVQAQLKKELRRRIIGNGSEEVCAAILLFIACLPIQENPLPGELENDRNNDRDS
ncbi:hypothetical protein Clacol_007324 [Clathrus columnatus]|uniref:Uncharacterized protein n=1 Tax=Clathrus columnatus TaxID=1419009 RepID=A0AAV5AK53_9AGAM|nr:hypothetical protein Clacol_007324 [Clathrus columnatus]